MLARELTLLFAELGTPRNSEELATVVTVVGTRPEVIKLAPVVKEFDRRRSSFHHLVVATAQHRSMLDQALQTFGLRVDFDLGLMKPNQQLGDFASDSLKALSSVFARIHPKVVVVQGDTTTSMTAALAAFYQGIPVAHVEAGLRTFDTATPFPEEMNRRLISALTKLHFAPTESARRSLIQEGIPEESVFVTGNTVVDALNSFDAESDFDEPDLRKMDFNRRRVVLVTVHRRENHGRLPLICRALAVLAGRFSDIEILLPVHPNPVVSSCVQRELAGKGCCRLVPPLSYADFLRALRRSYLVLTDSGGVQEEAASFAKPILVLRDVTERQEIIDAGFGRLVGTNPEDIVEEASELLSDPASYRSMCASHNPFGDGRAAGRIADIICRTVISPHRKLGDPVMMPRKAFPSFAKAAQEHYDD